jgi:hypothetical protein
VVVVVGVPLGGVVVVVWVTVPSGLTVVVCCVVVVPPPVVVVDGALVSVMVDAPCVPDGTHVVVPLVVIYPCLFARQVSSGVLVVGVF